jgi:hypothetical protein
MKNALLGLFTAFTLLAPASFAATCGNATPPGRFGATEKYSSILIDNDSIRITDFHPSAGSSGGDTSPWPSLIIEDTQRPGEIAAIRNFKSRWLPARTPLKIESPKGKEPYHALRIELKKGDCEPVKNPPLPPTDGVVIHDPRILVPFENAYVRVLEIEVKPGDAEPPHTHTWPSVVYYYRLPSSRRGSFDGKPSADRPELTKQQVTFENFPAPMHTLLNTGNYLYQAHRIEIKPVTDQPAKK